MAENQNEKNLDSLEKGNLPSGDIKLNFDYNLSAEKSGDLDAVMFNIYNLYYARFAHLKNDADRWARARAAKQEANKIQLQLEKIPPTNPSHTNALEELRALAEAKKITKMQLTTAQNVEFFGVDEAGNEVEIFKFNILALGKNQILEDAAAEREDLKKELPKEKRPERDWIADNIRNLNPYIDSERHFEPIRRIPIKLAAKGKTFSALDTIRNAGEKFFDVLPPKYRADAHCAMYVRSLLAIEYGTEVLKKFDLGEGDAWKIKEKSLKKGGTRIVSSTMDAIRLDNGIPYIKNSEIYSEEVASFFKAADQGKVPMLATVFFKGTNYKQEIRKSNAKLPPAYQSYNSHVIMVLGRGEKKSVGVTANESLTTFLKKHAKAKPEFQRNLNVRVIRNQAEIAVDDLQDFTLESGDIVEWQDVTVSDLFHGKERVLGLTEFLSDNQMILLEGLALSKEIKQEGHKKAPYKVTGYLKLKSKKENIKVQLMQELNLSEEDFSYYILALAELGIDTRKISTNTLIPLLDIGEIRTSIDARGGINVVQIVVIDKAIKRFNKNEERPGIGFLIKPSSSPSSMISAFFGNYFSDKKALTNAEKAYVLKMVDESCPSIQLSPLPAKFNSGDVVYLSKSRIEEIKSEIDRLQAEEFAPEDYVALIKSGDRPENFVSDCFEQEAAKLKLNLKYRDLDKFEKNYLLSALAYCNRWINLNITDGKLERFNVGDRIVFKKAVLNDALKLIAKKQKAQKFTEITSVKIVKPNSNKKRVVQAGRTMVAIQPKKDEIETTEYIIPEEVSLAVREVFPGSNFESSSIRNALYLIWANEQARGATRKILKWAHNLIAENKSVGLFQLRPTKRDFVACKDQLSKLNPAPKSPTTFEEFRDLVESDNRVSVLVAGNRLKESIGVFDAFMRLNGEKSPGVLDENYLKMILTSYNRSIEGVKRAVFQNWAYNLAEAVGIESKVPKNEIDAKISETNTKAAMEERVKNTFENVAKKLLAEGKIDFSGDINAEINIMFEDGGIRFLQSPLFKSMKDWYEKERNQPLSFVFNNKEIERGDKIFSYGTRVLPHGEWLSKFNNSEVLKFCLNRMQQKYVPPAETNEIAAILNN